MADERCDFGVVRALRKAGHDVVAMCEIARRTDDDDVIELASREDRVLITEDKDLGGWFMPRGLGLMESSFFAIRRLCEEKLSQPSWNWHVRGKSYCHVAL